VAGTPLHFSEEFPQLIGSSCVFRQMLELIAPIARSDAAVVLTGETGTGKELVARAIHYRGARREHPFVPINCGAIPDNLLENELFGHARGAYTGALGHEKGLVAECEKGTLFLDEVDSLSPAAQVKLLRLLQDREYRPLGSSRICHADIRIIAASNANLEARRAMRDDLYHRISTLALRVPPLRERPEDIPLLVQHFVEKYRSECPFPAPRPSARFVSALCSLAWPGNVRELEKTVRRALILTRSEVLEPELIESAAPSDAAEAERFVESKAAAIRRFEARYLAELMSANDGNVTRAAKAAGLDRRGLQRLLRRHRGASA
jgi:two-component system response regulator GlrR